MPHKENPHYKLVKYTIITIMNLHKKFEGTNGQMLGCVAEFKDFLKENKMMPEEQFYQVLNDIISHDKFEA